MNGSSRRLRWIVRVSARHIRSRRQSDRNTATRLSIVGIAVGVMALISVLSVMNGFQLGTIDAMLEVNSYHLRVQGQDAEAITDDQLEALRDLAGVRAVVPFSETETIVRGATESSTGAVVRALPDDALERDAGLRENLTLVEGRLDMSETGTIVVGSQLRRRLGARIGDTLTLLTLGAGSREDQSGRTRRVPREVQLEVVGTVRTGFFEYDAGWAFVSSETAERTFGVSEEDRVTGIKLDDRFAEAGARRRVAELLDLDESRVASWREFNRAMFGALRTEKVTMSLLLGLIFVVVAANIYQSLRRSVHERAEEIAILKALGARPSDIQGIFVGEGLVIGLVGALSGLAAGLLVAANVNPLFSFAETALNGLLGLLQPVIGGVAGTTEVSFLSPQVFYLTDVPVEIVFAEVLGVVMFALAMAVVAAWMASLRASGVRPAEVLRNE